MKRCKMVSAVGLIAVVCPHVTAETAYWIDAFYSNEKCDGTPYQVVASDADGACGEGDEPEEFECTADSGLSNKATCSTNYLSTMRDMFGSSPYIIQEVFDDSSCSSLTSVFIAYGYFASKSCVGSDTSSYIATLDTSEQSSIEYYNDSLCSDLLIIETASNSTLLDHSCDENYYKWYSSDDDLSEGSSSVSSIMEPINRGSNTDATVEMYQIDTYYSGGSCEGTPYRVISYANSTCAEASCHKLKGDAFMQRNCSENYLPEMKEMFGDSPYIIQKTFTDPNCSNFAKAYGYFASGDCEGRGESAKPFYHRTVLTSSEQASIGYYTDKECTKEDEKRNVQIAPKTVLINHSCDDNSYKNYKLYYEWYSSDDDPPMDNAGLGTGAIAGIICGVVVIVLVLLGLFVIYRRRSHDKPRRPFPTEPVEPGTITGQPHLWNDNVIMAKRIPRDKVKEKKILSSGAYGEVYRGVYNRRQVAIKMLLPATRGDLKYVNDFLSEAKLTATMDHPHIITFIGVAWDSLSDVCIVLEFMDGGDLRTLLNSYEATKRPVGFNKQKATIALHVCEALTYLHSLMPPVIHRDLKSVTCCQFGSWNSLQNATCIGCFGSAK